MTKKDGSADSWMSQSGQDLNLELIELERTQIGHEIHDALLPLIFAAASGVSHAIDRLPTDADESKTELLQVSDWLADALHTGRRLLSEIYPPELTGTRWVRAAKETIDKLWDQSERNPSWEIVGDVEETSPSVAMAAYRIVVESVRNAIRHGKSNEILIQATSGDEAIVIAVHDNGCGFDPTATPEDRFGIRAMAGRAKSVGGYLVVDSKPGGPTTIKFIVPRQRRPTTN